MREKKNKSTPRSIKKELKPEIRTMAYMAAHGASFHEMSDAFGWTDSRVRMLLTTKVVKAEVERIRMQIYGNPSQKIKSILPEAIQVEYDIMTDTDVKPNVRHSVAKTFIEQGMGKPKQNIQVDGGFTIRNLFEKLDQAQLQKPQEPVPIEIESMGEVNSPESCEVDDFMTEFERDKKDEE